MIGFSRKMKIMDRPNERKVHSRDIPILGGLAIYISFLISVFLFEPVHRIHDAVLVGSFFIIMVGIVDDVHGLKPWEKLIGQILAATIVIFLGDIQVDFVHLPFGGTLHFGQLSIPITYFWIIGVTNAINFIDGLDGLSAGVSVIALISISGMAFLMNDHYVYLIALVLVGSILGFLPYNFYPAKIFMGDTGALFLGFIISVLSLLGFKNITFISFIVPILILGVPISDTFLAIVRRVVHKRPISKPDQSHLHHCLMNIGFTHLEAVILIYAISSLFALSAFIFSMTTVSGSLFLLFLVLFFLELLIEKVGLVHHQYKPILKLFDNVRVIRQKNK
ncbi:MraY family glycosyltransferase [Fervidibacillus halotolerans]|uniref:Undecaprenyl/decaprenyl-phosphate alpha-N-acetylglucosaminyl 1-phosphate transferase n=1 Tax=Fervidibacillus halotolerans TaxID=2980027 RepID=A0A9E8M2A3_9BACI|nr:MraY family glycosyltransferase [Fervidibacillus halotolerans]WAA13971.1 undecaprenyl/decaprenyl-phosphate alpha-N-acetylglucosaminyl 1-phosphate transferase [Fervidibacillus halotolerans]